MIKIKTKVLLISNDAAKNARLQLECMKQGIALIPAQLFGSVASLLSHSGIQFDGILIGRYILGVSKDGLEREPMSRWVSSIPMSPGNPIPFASMTDAPEDIAEGYEGRFVYNPDNDIQELVDNILEHFPSNDTKT